MMKGKYYSLTADHWTSCANRSFMAATVHFITDDWKLRSHTLCCKEHIGDHTAPNILLNINNVMVQFDLTTEVLVATVTDTAPNMNSLGQLLEDDLNNPTAHLYCADHVLELTTKTTNDFVLTNSTLKKARALVTHINESPDANVALLNVQQANGVAKPVTVVQDIKTRWWSTFNMCKRLLRLRTYFDLMHQNGRLASKLVLDADEWKLIVLITQILKPFMVAQKLLEGETYVTISLLTYMIGKLRKGLEAQFYNNIIAEELRASLLNHFNDQWGTGADNTIYDQNSIRGRRNRKSGIHAHALVAAAVDPRTKFLPFVEANDRRLIWEEVTARCVEIGNLRMQERNAVNNIQDQDQSDDESQQSLHGIFDDFAELAQQYMNDDSDNGSQIDDETVQAIVAREIKEFKSKRTPLLPILENDNDVDEFDDIDDQPKSYNNPLVWWENNCNKFPHIAILARQVLCIPATSAPSERVFSAAGLTIANSRARLLPEHADDLVILRNAFLNGMDV